jgi:hypothetical protein
MAVPAFERRRKPVREILFRGRTPETGNPIRGNRGEWVSGPGITVDKSGCVQIRAHEECGTVNYSVDAETVGEWTGLHDKNGAKIFEGDLVRIYMDVLRVKWHEPFASFVLSHADADLLVTFDEYEDADYEVIGNVHDNPELWSGDAARSGEG